MTITLNTRQTALLTAKKTKVAWLFTVTDANDVRYYWSTKEHSIGTEPNPPTGWESGEEWAPYEHFESEYRIDHTAKILEFPGITLRRNNIESGITGPDDLSFWVSNPSNTMTATDFKGGTVWLSLACSDADGYDVMRRWRFRIKNAEKGYQKFKLTCENWLEPYLRGGYPNTQLVRDLWPGTEEDAESDVCVPVVFGTGYIPLASVYIPEFYSLTDTTISAVASANGARCKIQDSGDGLGIFEVGRYITVTGFTDANNNISSIRALVVGAGEIELPEDAGLVTEAAGDTVTIKQGTRAYVLGDSANTYTITTIRSPRELGPETSWASATYTMTQTTKTDGDSNTWKVLQPIIADLDNDGTPDAPGVFGLAGGPYNPMPCQFSVTDTNTPTLANMTNPADVLWYILKDMGVPGLYLDMVSNAAAGATYSTWTLAWNGGLWKKWKRKKLLAMLLTMCHSTIILDEGLELHPLSKTSQATFTDADVMQNSFRHRDTQQDQVSDSGYIAWQASGRAQDKFLKTLVTAKTTKVEIADETLDVPWVADSQDAQRIGTLHYQRKLLKAGEISFDTGDTHINLNPDDVITLNDTPYGGSTTLLIDQMTIHKDLRVSLKCTEFSVALDDWTDLTPDVITVAADDTQDTFAPPVAGPLSIEGIGSQGFEVWGNPFITVAPNVNQGMYTNIQYAINALASTSHNGIYLLNGTYTLSGPIYFIDRDIEIIGESRGGVIIQNNPGDEAFILHNLTKTMLLSNFSIASQNVASYEEMILIYGDTTADNTTNVTIEKVTIDAVDNNTINSSGDMGIEAEKGQDGSLTIRDVKVTGGRMNMNIDDYTNSKVIIEDSTFDDATTQNLLVESDYIHVVNNKIDNVWLGGLTGVSSGNDYCVIQSNVVIAKNDSNAASNNRYGVKLWGNGINFQNNIINWVNTWGTPNQFLFQGLNGQNCNYSNNVFNADVSTDDLLVCISLSTISNSVISNNAIKGDNDDNTDSHYGIIADDSDRNVISSNMIDMVNNDAKDIGIYLNGFCDNNQGGDNITYNVGTSISDAGSGNVVTAQDV